MWGRKSAAKRQDHLLPQVVDINGLPYPLQVKRHPRSAKVSLRVDAMGDKVLVSAPDWLPAPDILDFIAAKQGWLQQRIARLPPRQPFRDGANVPILGVDHLISHSPHARRGVWRESDENGQRVVYVCGQAEHLPRRLTDWLKKTARAELAPRVKLYRQRLARETGMAAESPLFQGRLSMRDPRTRWASCSASGDLSFSWRLIMAPPEVMDYVVAHEIAHLQEMNHGPKFWRLVHVLYGDCTGPKGWLKRYGNQLHRYG